MDENYYRLRKFYAEIILGGSSSELKQNKIFIRHFSAIEQGELDGQYLVFFNKAVSRGLQTEKERESVVKKQGLWSDAQDKKIEELSRDLKGKRDYKKNLIYASQITQINKEIDSLSLEVNKLTNEKQRLLGTTAESFAKKKLNEVYIFHSLFSDKNFQCPLFSEEDFKDLDDTELDTIVTIYNATIGALHGDIISKIALSSFFQDAFSLVDDNLYHFFGKPISLLSFFQIELARYGKFFKHVLSSEPKPPEYLLTEPTKLIDWYNSGKNGKKLIDSHEHNQVVALMGSKDDIAKVAEAQGKEVVSFSEIASKQGKTKLNKQDLMNILS